MPTLAAYLKCGFCEYQTLRFRRLKNGKTQHGYTTLANHVEDAHHTEYEQINARVMTDYDSAPDTLEGKEEERW